MYKLLLLLGIVTPASLTGSLIQDQITKCSTECAVTGIHKLFYIPSKTYTYDYKVHSVATFEGVPGATSKITWHNEVDLSWISPCDVVITLRDPLQLEGEDTQTFPILTKYPMAAAISGGIVQKICSHPDDPPGSVNFKKGIVSILQNSLPSFSPIHNLKTFHEQDSVGVCPTQYKISNEDPVLIVRKFKNHKDCTKRFDAGSESSFLNKLLYESPFPLTRSQSTCQQEIQNGIFQRVTCSDENFLHLSNNNKKCLHYSQHSELRYVRDKHEMPPNLSNLKTFRRTNLMSEIFQNLPSSESTESEIDAILDRLCNRTLKGVGKGTAKTVSDLIELLGKINAETIFNIFHKIKTKKICRNSFHLKSIFLDIVSYIKQEGSLKVMIQQMLGAHSTAFRKQMYIASIFLTQQVNEKLLEYMIPVFKHPSLASSVLSLACANLIRLYCETHADCALQPSIETIMGELSKELFAFCPVSSSNGSSRTAVLTALKSIGNIGYMNLQLQNVIFKCLTSKRPDAAVRVAAVESFRRMKCSKVVTEKLLHVVFNVIYKDELRISSYLEAIRCVDKKQLRRITEFIAKENKLNVAVFIASHLRENSARNLPHQNFEFKEYLQSHPTHPTKYNDSESFTSNYFEYYFATFGTGIRVENKLIQFPDTATMSFSSKIEIAYLFEILEAAEISLRGENFGNFLAPLLEVISKSENPFIEAVRPALIDFIKKIGLLSDNSSAVISLNSKVEKPFKKSRIDATFRLFGVDLFYQTLDKDIMSYIQNNFLRNLWTEIAASPKVFEMILVELTSTRVLHLNSEAFLPSIHGIALVVKLQTTTLIGLNTDVFGGKNCSEEKSSKCYLMAPEFSSNSQIYIGSDFGSFVGLQFTNNVHLSEELTIYIEPKEGQLKVQLPTSKDIVSIVSSETEMYLKKGTSYRHGHKVIPLNVGDSHPRIKKETCLPSKLSYPGFKFCWKLNCPNLKTNSMIPLGQPTTVQLFFKKTNPKIKSLELFSVWKSQTNSLDINTTLSSVDGTTNSLSGVLKLNIIDKEKYFSLAGYLSPQDDENNSGNGMKIILERLGTKQGSKNDLSVFLSNTERYTSSDKIFCLRHIFGYEKNNTTVEIKMTTLNGLASIVKINFEAEFDYGSEDKNLPTPLGTKWGAQNSTSINGIDISTQKSDVNQSTSHSPLRIHLKKSLGMHLKDVLEHPFKNEPLINKDLLRLFFKKVKLELCSGSLQMNALIERVKSDRLTSQYRFGAMVKVGHVKETIKGDVAFKGLEKQRSITISSDIYSESSTSNCHIKTELKHNLQEFKIGFMVENLNSKETLFLVKFSKERKSLSEIHFVSEAEVWVHGYIPHCVIEGEVVETEHGTYHTKYVVSRGNEHQVSVEGKIVLLSDSSFTKERVNLNISGLSGGPYQFKGGYEFSLYKNKILFSLVDPNDQIFYVRLAQRYQLACEYCHTCTYELHIPKLITGKLNGERKVEDFLVNSFFTVFPGEPMETDLKSQISSNFNTKELVATFSFGKKNNYEKCEIISQYDFSFMKRLIFLKGIMNAYSKEYSFNFEGSLGKLDEKVTKMHLLVDLGKPPGETFKLETMYKKESANELEGDTTMLFHMTTFSNTEFKWDSKFGYVLETNSTDMATNGRLDLKTTLLSDLSLQIETNSNSAKEHKFISADINFTSPFAPAKSTSKISFHSYPNETKNTTSLFTYLKPSELNITVENWGKKKTNLTIESSVNQEENLYVGLEMNGDRRFGLNMNQHNESEFSLAVLTPSETIGIAFKISFKEVGLTLYPNHEYRSRRFDPKKLKEFNVLLNMAIEQTTMQAHIDVNGSSSGSEKILVSIESIKLSNGSYKTEAIFRSASLKSNPRIRLETAFTPSTKSLSVSFRHSSSAPTSVSFGAVYTIYPMEYQRSFYGYLISTKNTINLTANILDYRSTSVALFPLGDFTLINGTLNSSSFGLLDYASRFSQNPASLMVTSATNHSSMQMNAYFGQRQCLFGVGFKKGGNSEIMSENPEVLDRMDDVALRASTKLLTPSIMSMEYGYNLMEIKELMDTLCEGFNQAMLSINEITSEIIDEVFTKSLESNSESSRYQQVIEEVELEFQKLYLEMELDQLFPYFSFLKKELRLILEETLELYTEMADKLRQILTDTMLNIYSTFVQDFESINSFVVATLQSWIRDLEDSYESLREGFEKIQWSGQIRKYFLATNIWKCVKNHGEEFYITIQEEIVLVSTIFDTFKTLLKDETYGIWDQIWSHEYIKSYCEELKTWLRTGPSKFLTSIWHNTFDFSLSKKSDHFKVIVPLVRPAHSLQTADVGVPQKLETFSWKETLEAWIFDSFSLRKNLKYLKNEKEAKVTL